MTITQAGELVAVLKAAWPRQPVSPDTLRLYAEMLADLDHGAAVAGVRALIATAKWFPSVAEIREACLPWRMSAEEAWSLVIERVRSRGSYDSGRFDDPTVTRAVDAIGWLALCASTYDQIGVHRAHFLRVYDALAAAGARAGNLASLEGHGRPTGGRLATTDGAPMLGAAARYGGGQ